MSFLRNEEIVLRLVGDGPMKSSLVKQAEALGLKSVIFERPVSKNEIRNVASGANAFVFNLIDSPRLSLELVRTNCSISWLRAVQCVCCDTTNNIIEDSGWWCYVLPDDPGRSPRP